MATHFKSGTAMARVHRSPTRSPYTTLMAVELSEQGGTRWHKHCGAFYRIGTLGWGLVDLRLQRNAMRKSRPLAWCWQCIFMSLQVCCACDNTQLIPSACSVRGPMAIIAKDGA